MTDLPLTFLGCLGVAIAILALQYGHARWLDLRLPKRERLPVWLRGGPTMYRRRTALYAYPWLSTFLAVLLLFVAAMQEISPGPRTRVEMMIAVGFAMALFALVQLFSWRFLMRWFARGEPKV